MCRFRVSSRYGIQDLFEFILLSDEATEKHMTCLKTLLNLGACVNTTLPNRHTSAISLWKEHHNLTARAAGLGFWHGVQLLMEYGAKPPDHWHGKTSMMFQIWKRQLARCWSAKKAMERLLQGTMHKDLAPLISHHIWETRHDSAWRGPQRQQPKTKPKKKG